MAACAVLARLAAAAGPRPGRERRARGRSRPAADRPPRPCDRRRGRSRRRGRCGRRHARRVRWRPRRAPGPRGPVRLLALHGLWRRRRATCDRARPEERSGRPYGNHRDRRPAVSYGCGRERAGSPGRRRAWCTDGSERSPDLRTGRVLPAGSDGVRAARVQPRQPGAQRARWRGTRGPVVSGPFLLLRTAVSRERAASRGADPGQVDALVRHAAALADRLDALPLPADRALRRSRQERVERLRAVVRLGHGWTDRKPGDFVASGSSDRLRRHA